MKVYFKDVRLRRHSVDVDEGASVAHLKLLLANMSLVPAGFVPNLVYQTRNLSDAECVGGIGYSPDRSISLVCVRAAPASAAAERSFNLRGQAMRTRLQLLKQPLRLPQHLQAAKLQPLSQPPQLS